MKNTVPGLYIHIPFCVQKCDYCGFYSIAANQNEIDFFVAKLEEEIERTFSNKGKFKVNTIFIGGGNPTCIGFERFNRIVKKLQTHIDFSEIQEFTIETNPETFDKNWAILLKQIPNIRISMGIQRLSDKELTLLGRRARLDDVYRAAETICMHFENFSFDFIMGVPGCKTLAPELADFLIKFPARHISAYFLTLEPESVMEKRVLNDELPDPDNVGPEELYEVRHVLKDLGFSHYEISNYAKPGFECKHNLGYWLNQNYFALGPSGVATLDMKRISNPANLLDWATFENQEIEQLSEIDLKNEFIMLRLRLLNEGLNIDLLKKRFGNLTEEFLKTLDIELESGNLIKVNQNVILSEKGIAFANSIISKFFI